MSVADFQTCIDLVLMNEGGMNLDPDEPGGRTCFGIAEKYYPEAWAKGGPPTKHEAEVIYRRDFWEIPRINTLPGPIAAMLLDFGVQSGPSRAIKAMQWLISVKQDGYLGPATFEAVARWDAFALAEAICDVRMAFLRLLASSNKAHARRLTGYTNRITKAKQFLAQHWA